MKAKSLTMLLDTGMELKLGRKTGITMRVNGSMIKCMDTVCTLLQMVQDMKGSLQKINLMDEEFRLGLMVTNMMVSGLTTECTAKESMTIMRVLDMKVNSFNIKNVVRAFKLSQMVQNIKVSSKTIICMAMVF